VTDKPQLWEISWGPAIDAPYPVVLEETYPYRSTKMTLEYIKATPTLSTITRRVKTRTLELDDTQVERIVRLWAIAHAGFTDPEVEATCMYYGTFTGMSLTEETTQLYDDRDTPVEGD
jgi:hypothetical protein